MIILPITMTSVNWTEYLVAMKSALGYNVTLQLDSEGKSPNNLSAYVVTLGNMINPDLKPNEILSQPGPLLRHISFGFLCALDSDLLFSILENSRLTVTSIEQRLAVITGTLDTWRSDIINGSTELSTHKYRLFLNVCMSYLEKHSFEPLWFNYQKRLLHDKTYILKEK